MRTTDGVRGTARLVAIVLIVALVSACFAEQSRLAAFGTGRQPGFLYGLWHGFIAPIGFIVSLFSEKVRIYAVPNAGRWYDFGFMIGISGFSGGIFAGSRPRRKKSD
ncbi:MAG: hypothetical protein ACREOK_14535 [Gemmatimonadaceae bacterium]